MINRAIKSNTITCIVAILFFFNNFSFAAKPDRLSKETFDDIFGTRNFIENKGQFNASIKSTDKVEFALENGAEYIYFTKTGVTYIGIRHTTYKQWLREEKEKGNLQPGEKKDRVYQVNMRWKNANSNVVIEASDKQHHYFSYGNIEYKSNCYKKITYKNIYNNIDIEYIIPTDRSMGVKYNVILHPGADPSDIKMAYDGDINEMKMKEDGNITITTDLEPIIEHAPMSFYQGGEPIASKFALHEGVITFEFPNGYNTSKEVVIDPWVTTITTLANNNHGYDVDWDFNGNLFVYGGTTPWRTAKYNSAGALQWTFAGIVAVPAWNGNGGTNYVSNFCVNRATGKTYIGQGWVPAGGTRVIRLDVNGIYDNFISVANNLWQEVWDMGFQCTTGAVYGMGGCPSANMSCGQINQVSGAVTVSSFMAGNASASQDITSSVMDDQGNAFVYYTSSNAAIINRIARINPALTNTVWIVPSTYNVMNYCAMKNNFIAPIGGPSNGFNCLAVNANYLYYYDGFNLAAFNKNTGVKVAFTTIAGQNLRAQGGIDVDDCDNVYLGGNGQILSYHFNGTTFAALPAIAVGGTSPNKFVFDLKLDRINNQIYACGSGFVGNYVASNSTTCTVSQYSVVVTCVGGNNATAVTNVTTTIPNPSYSFTYVSSSATVATFGPQASSSSTVNLLTNGNYTVNIQINAPCGPIKTETFNVNCSCSATAAVTSSCTPTGPSIQLSVTATSGFTTAPTFSWSGPASYTSALTNPLIFNGSFGVYTLTASQPGCSTTYTVNAIAVSIFTPNITSTAVTCFGGADGNAEVSTITGTSTAPYTYTWSTTPVQTTSLVTALTAGNYTVQVTDANGCTYQNTVTITQPPALVVGIISNTLQNCPGVPFNLTGTGATTYTWSPNVALSATTGVNVSATPLATQVYSLLGVQNTCTGVATITLTVLPLPAITIVPSSPTLCMNNFNGSTNTVVLQANGATTYTWTNITGVSTNTTNGSSIIGTSILQSSVITGTVLGTLNTCTSQAGFTLGAIPNPSISVSSATICSGEATDIVANGASTYSWSPSIALNAITGATVTANPTITTVYSVIGSSLNCNSTTETGTVTVSTTPTITMIPLTSTICEGNSIALNSGGAITYTWSPGASLNTTNGNLVTASPITTTNYTVVGTMNNCTAQVVGQVSVIPVPTIQIVANRTVICRGQVANINANGALGYAWSPAVGLPNPNSNFISVSPVATTTYVLLGNNGACTATLNIPIVVVENPVLQLSTSNNKICRGNSTSIFASGAQTYSWSPLQTIYFVNPNTASVNPVSNINYTVTGINTSGTVSCVMTKEIEIQVVPQVTASISNSVALCFGESIKLKAGGGDTYIWTPAEGLSNTLIAQPYATPSITTIYTAQVSYSGFCGESKTVKVVVSPNPTVNAGSDLKYNTDEPMYLTAKGSGTLTWIFGEEIYCKSCPSTQIFPKVSGCYKIQAVNEFNCKATDDVCVELTTNYNLFIPNSFTPNGDGLNDLFLIYGTGLNKLELIIFDRWGEKLYTTTDQQKGWDGTYKGGLCKEDTYVYLVNYTALDGKKHTKTGHVTLLK